MQLVVKIACDNAAFEGDNLAPELARILRELAASIDDGSAAEAGKGLGTKLRDLNGNVVGIARIE